MDIENEKVDIQDEKVYLYGTDKQNRQLIGEYTMLWKQKYKLQDNK